jgi:hypothetical protein
MIAVNDLSHADCQLRKLFTALYLQQWNSEPLVMYMKMCVQIIVLRNQLISLTLITEKLPHNVMRAKQFSYLIDHGVTVTHFSMYSYIHI